MLSREEMLKLAKLSRIQLSEEEITEFSQQFGSMMEYMDNLRQLDLAGLEPLTSHDPDTGVLRKDENKPSLSKAKAFQNAPSADLDHFVIPKVIHG